MHIQGDYICIRRIDLRMRRSSQMRCLTLRNDYCAICFLLFDRISLLHEYSALATRLGEAFPMLRRLRRSEGRDTLSGRSILEVPCVHA